MKTKTFRTLPESVERIFNIIACLTNLNFDQFRSISFSERKEEDRRKDRKCDSSPPSKIPEIRENGGRNSIRQFWEKLDCGGGEGGVRFIRRLCPVRYIRKIRSIRKIARLDGKVRKSNGVLQTSPPLLLLLPPPFGVG